MQANENIFLWRRYIDDVFAALINDTTAESILDMANNIADGIHFTIEKPSERGKLPFLDCLVSLNVQTLPFTTEFYSKELHSNHLLPYDSNVPHSRKIALLKSERLRARRICSSEHNFKRALKFSKLRFQANGYPL